MSKRKFVAIFKTEIRVDVELGEHESWEDAARVALKLKKTDTPKAHYKNGQGEDRVDELYLDRIWYDPDDGSDTYEFGHEIIDACNLCGVPIIDGCGRTGCKEQHVTGSRGGWVSTEHGHQAWCSTSCRERDPYDCERPENNVDEED